MKRPAIIAWALFLIVIANLVSSFVTGLRDGGGIADFAGTVLGLGWGLAGAVYAGIAALIIARQPHNRVGWLLMVSALLGVASVPMPTAPVTAVTPILWMHTWFYTWSALVPFLPVFLIPLHFPTGGPPSAKWRWVNWLALTMWVLVMALSAFKRSIGPDEGPWSLPNPMGFIPDGLASGLLGATWGIGLMTLLTGSVASLFVRYRRAGVVERAQIKWLLYAGALFALILAVVLMTGGRTADGPGAWAVPLLILALLTFPVAIGIAILRYRLFDIDVIIRKTAVYGVLTGLLALVYFGSVVLLQTILGSFTNGQSPIILVISTLLIAALFAPLRRQVQGLIDRRFYRRKYDAQQVLARFAQTARDETNIDALTAELLVVLSETLQPESVAVWVSK